MTVYKVILTKVRIHPTHRGTEENNGE